MEFYKHYRVSENLDNEKKITYIQISTEKETDRFYFNKDKTYLVYSFRPKLTFETDFVELRYNDLEITQYYDHFDEVLEDTRLLNYIDTIKIMRAEALKIIEQIKE